MKQADKKKLMDSKLKCSFIDSDVTTPAEEVMNNQVIKLVPYDKLSRIIIKWMLRVMERRLRHM